MANVTGGSGMSMASLYAMLGLAMPSGASGTAAMSPALAMVTAANQSASAEVSTLLGSLPAASSAKDLASALLSLANLDPTVELERLQTALQANALTSSG